MLLANYAARGPRFSAELDAVISQVCMTRQRASTGPQCYRTLLPSAVRPTHISRLGGLLAQAVVSVMNTVLLGVLLPPRHAQAVRVFAAQDGGLRAGLAVLPPHVFASSPT